MEIIGKRIYPREDGKLYLKEGDYGFNPILNCWQVRPPGVHTGSIPYHQVTEHEDGSITVSPSILLMEGDITIWHGYLVHGVWQSV